LDYASPQYADYKVGKHVMIENQQLFLDKGYDRLVVELQTPQNKRYFRKMGFQYSAEKNKTELFKDLS